MLVWHANIDLHPRLCVDVCIVMLTTDGFSLVPLIVRLCEHVLGNLRFAARGGVAA